MFFCLFINYVLLYFPIWLIWYDISCFMSINCLIPPGRSHPAKITFCECETVAETLIRFGFWPSSPTRPAAAFSLDLLQLMHTLTLECAVSVKGFVNTMRWMNNLTLKQVIYLFCIHPLSSSSFYIRRLRSLLTRPTLSWDLTHPYLPHAFIPSPPYSRVLILFPPLKKFTGVNSGTLYAGPVNFSLHHKRETRS